MFCYRFPDRATFLSLCDTLGWLSVVTEQSPEASLIAYTHDRAVDEVGPVVTVPGTYDEDGSELTAPVVDSGHHVNLIGSHPVEFESYLVLVNSPYRQFAGHSGPSVDPNAPVVLPED